MSAPVFVAGGLAGAAAVNYLVYGRSWTDLFTIGGPLGAVFGQYAGAIALLYRVEADSTDLMQKTVVATVAGAVLFQLLGGRSLVGSFVLLAGAMVGQYVAISAYNENK